jgi:hypothetical protein
MQSLILIRTGLRCAVRIARRLLASPLAVMFNAPLTSPVFRKLIPLTIAQTIPLTLAPRHRQHTDRSGPFSAPARPLSYAAPGRHFL